MAEKEIGWVPVELTDAAPGDLLFAALPRHFRSFQWHDYAAGVPPGAVELARNEICPQAFRLGDAAWGAQFHPEVRLEQLVRWIRAYEEPPVPPAPYIAAARNHIGEWNDIGRALCERFFTAASSWNLSSSQLRARRRVPRHAHLRTPVAGGSSGRSRAAPCG